MLIEKTTLPKIEENTVQKSTIKAEKLLKTLSEMPSDFYFEERTDEPPQKRDEFKTKPFLAKMTPSFYKIDNRHP